MGEHGCNLEIEERRVNSRSAFRLLCECGYRIRCHVKSYGGSLGELVFFDDAEASTTWDERVWHCPRCQTRLGLTGLRS